VSGTTPSDQAAIRVRKCYYLPAPNPNPNAFDFHLGLSVAPDSGRLVKLLFALKWPHPSRLPHFRLLEATEEETDVRLRPFLPDPFRKLCNRLAAEGDRTAGSTLVASLSVSYTCTAPSFDRAAVTALRENKTLALHRLALLAVELSKVDERPRGHIFRWLLSRRDALGNFGCVLADGRLELAAKGPTAERLRQELGAVKTRPQMADDPLPVAESLLVSLWTVHNLANSRPAKLLPVQYV